MQKAEAISLLGGTVTATAEAIGISTSAVSQWPDELPDAIRDRVQAALFRRATELGLDPKPAPSTSTQEVSNG